MTRTMSIGFLTVLLAAPVAGRAAGPTHGCGAAERAAASYAGSGLSCDRWVALFQARTARAPTTRMAHDDQTQTPHS